MLFQGLKSSQKYLFIFLILLILASGTIILFYYFSIQGQQARKYARELNTLYQEEREQEIQSQDDQYGGTTPEKTYQLFLTALEDNDLDLASKYFIFNRQEEYRQLFLSIQKNNEWDEMMTDLLNHCNSKGKYENEDSYLIQILDDDHNLVTTIHLVPVKNSTTKNSSIIWKIIEF